MMKQIRVSSLVAAAVFTFGSLVAAVQCEAEPPQKAPEGPKAIAAGEFAVAKAIPPASLSIENDAWLAQVATAQSLSGEMSAAAATVRQIDSPSQRRSVIDQTRQQTQGGGARGGGAFADFDSLMNLIETTVVPDTWEALGGNSTMAPYPQGVFVDASGTVEAVERMSNDEAFSTGALENLGVVLSDASAKDNRDWRTPSEMRCVSLRRLRDEIATRRLQGIPIGDALLHMAGMTEVRFLVFTDDDIILAGSVGGIESNRGWYVDRETGRSTLRSDFLARCLASAFDGVPFGCTIDPTPEGMQNAMTVAAEIRNGSIPIGKSADALRQALGKQRVEVFGAAGDTAVGLLMVEADRHMKQLALGEETLPEGVDSYLDVVDDFIAQGPPNGLLLRLWFTAAAQKVRSDHEQKVFEISGNAIRLSGENQRALADGNRGKVTVDPRSKAFVEGFNKNWNRIRDEYPIYGSLESLYRVAAVSHLVARYGSEETHRKLAMGIAMEDESRDWNIIAPKKVESIATLHTVRSGKKRHHVLLASGGVSVETKLTVAPDVESYPTLAGQESLGNSQPPAVNRWWWDAR